LEKLIKNNELARNEEIEEVKKILKMKDNKIEQIESEKLEILKQSETKQEKITNL
jgi:hypothetical protein